ncbi:Glycoside hydrolase 18 protein [Ptychographa xylographoides]|nr:Glycoside hydrolase 18 protein [Ptychographa xylographoides]
MKFTGVAALIFASVALAQAVTEFTDGQPQAPTSSAYTNPFTSYLTETNSEGVVTGMPSVVTSMPTSIPAVVTSMPAVETSVGVAATFVSGSPGIPAVPTTAVVPIVSPPVISSGFATVPAGSNSTVTTASPSASGTASTTGTPSASGSSSAAPATSSTPASAAVSMVQPALGLGLVAAIFAALL